MLAKGERKAWIRLSCGCYGAPHHYIVSWRISPSNIGNGSLREALKEALNRGTPEYVNTVASRHFLQARNL